MNKGLWFSVIVAFLSACTTVDSSEPQRSEQQYRDTVVVNAEPGFSLYKGQTICPHPLLEDAMRNPQRSDLQAYDTFYQAVVNKFKALGLDYQNSAEASCNYWMAFALPTSNILSDEQLMSLFGVSPGLADNSDEHFQKATLMMSLYSSQSKVNQWQVSLQAFAKVANDAQGRRNLEISREGINYVVNRVFSYLNVN
ncbi:hypothetical protein [Agarivorans sp.]|uniref:hypothetical protein n=1 Tax=Agarivorans sp. TaxID=1872412 RepID=UPI003D01742C